jgi:hypothetical protein
MNNLLISLNDNILKITLKDELNFKGVTVELPKTAANDTQIIDTNYIARTVSETLNSTLTFKGKAPILHFLIEPQDVILKFVTVNKKNGDIDSQIVNEIKSKLTDINIDDLYFSYQKIAPFVYQFLGVKKTILEKYIEISDLLKFELKSVIPWVLMLPKYVNSSDPCIFVSKNLTNQTIALSELNGIYFSSVFDQEKSPEELQKLVSELSVYKRVAPITKVYSLNTDFFSLDPSYQIQKLKVNNVENAESSEYLLHLLYYSLLETNPSILGTQLNLLNALPLPAVQKKNTSLVYVGAAVGVAAVIFVLLAGLNTLNKNDMNNSDKLAQNTDSPTVLGNETVNESTQAVSEEPKKDLKKSDLSIRVENGAGIPGVAAKARDFLKGLGYNVLEIGNAEESDRQTTLVKIKAAKADYKDMILDDMKKTYQVTLEDTLPDSSAYDVLVLVGVK